MVSKSVDPQSELIITKGDSSIQTQNAGFAPRIPGYELEDFIDTEYEQGSQSQPSKTRLQIFTYGQDTLNLLLNAGFNFSLAMLRQSLEIGSNINRLQEIDDLSDINRFGTIYVTQDGLVSLELITTA
jgi:hypothetical protein